MVQIPVKKTQQSSGPRPVTAPVKNGIRPSQSSVRSAPSAVRPTSSVVRPTQASPLQGNNKRTSP